VVKKFYPGVLERGARSTFAVWFPDFPGCVAAGISQDDALEKAEQALAQKVDELSEREQPLPASTPFASIAIPKRCTPIAYFAVGVEPPNPSERVNIYLPKNLIAQADKRALELGMSRSSFFGLAISSLVGWSGTDITSLGMPRSKVHQIREVTGTKSRPKNTSR
jgi:predicted RNase H-like HicB family nuclease/Arc/MetJ family transcription regulator